MKTIQYLHLLETVVLVLLEVEEGMSGHMIPLLLRVVSMSTPADSYNKIKWMMGMMCIMMGLAGECQDMIMI